MRPLLLASPGPGLRRRTPVRRVMVAQSVHHLGAKVWRRTRAQHRGVYGHACACKGHVKCLPFPTVCMHRSLWNVYRQCPMNPYTFSLALGATGLVVMALGG